MRIAYISTYPPRKCGIGTFNQNLVKAVFPHTGEDHLQDQAFVIAMKEEDQNYEFPPEVKFTIRTNHQKDYIKAARFINFSGADICVLQHEFGLYGGEMGVYILPLLHQLTIPLITICHTVLKDPSYMQRSVLAEIGAKSTKFVVMSQLAVEFLKSVYKIPSTKINLISHGTPVFKSNLQHSLKQSFNFQSKKYSSLLDLLVAIKVLKPFCMSCLKLLKSTRRCYILSLELHIRLLFVYPGKNIRNH